MNHKNMSQLKMVDTRKLHRKMPRLIVQEPSTPFMYILLYNFGRARKFETIMSGTRFYLF